MLNLRTTRWVVSVGLLTLAIAACAQEAGDHSEGVATMPGSEPGEESGSSAIDPQKRLDFEEHIANLEASSYLSLIILIFGFGVLLIETILLWRINASPADVLKIFAVSTIVVGTLFIVTAGFEAEKVAPAMGLFGTVAGYLLGRRKKDDDA